MPRSASVVVIKNQLRQILDDAGDSLGFLLVALFLEAPKCSVSFASTRHLRAPSSAMYVKQNEE